MITTLRLGKRTEKELQNTAAQRSNQETRRRSRSVIHWSNKLFVPSLAQCPEGYSCLMTKERPCWYCLKNQRHCETGILGFVTFGAQLYRSEKYMLKDKSFCFTNKSHGKTSNQQQTDLVKKYCLCI